MVLRWTSLLDDGMTLGMKVVAPLIEVTTDIAPVPRKPDHVVRKPDEGRGAWLGGLKDNWAILIVLKSAFHVQGCNSDKRTVINVSLRTSLK